MKKMILMAAVMCLGLAVQAAAVNWEVNNLWGVAVNDGSDYSVRGNGDYLAMGGSFYGSLNCVLTIYSNDGLKTQIDQAEGTITGPSGFIGIDHFGGEKEATYLYEIVIDGTQTSLTSKTSPDYDYSAAKISATLNGTFEFDGTVDIEDVPDSWTVSGVQAIPEPTSGLLLLIGLAGIALKRKRTKA